MCLAAFVGLLPVVSRHFVGKFGLVEACTFPLTGVGCITRVYTSLAVVDIEGGRFVLREKLADISFDELQSLTGATLRVDGDVIDLNVPQLG